MSCFLDSFAIKIYNFEYCDEENNRPVGPVFAGPQSFTIQFNDRIETITATPNFTGSSIEIIFSGSIFGNTPLIKTFNPRYRREYEDYTLEETKDFTLKVGEIDYTFNMDFKPHCRKEGSDFGFCGGGNSVCFNESLYNLIELEDLNKYPMPKEICKTNSSVELNGRPIDIDVISCGTGSLTHTENEFIDGGVTMYYSPYGSVVPVIDNFAYDITNLPTPDPGKINVIKLTTKESRNLVRDWCCNNLKFATVREPFGSITDWRTSPVVGIGSIGSGFEGNENIRFNWPFNDLYFSDGCPNGDTCNLVPC